MQDWLERLGYSDEPDALHLRDRVISHAHPHALELNALLKPDGEVRAHAVFDVERMPTVIFLGADDEPLSLEALDEARKRIWNQNLATVVIDVQGDQALALQHGNCRRQENFSSWIKLVEMGPFRLSMLCRQTYLGASLVGLT